MPSSPLPLKDIHIPEAIGWWPPAIGWWLVAILLLAALVGGYKLYKRLRRKTAIKTATILLQALKQNDMLSPQQKLRELSILIRRVAISINPRHKTASLTGNEWLAYLDSSMQNSPFSQGVGQSLAHQPYKSMLSSELNIVELLHLCEDWLKQQKASI